MFAIHLLTKLCESTAQAALDRGDRNLQSRGDLARREILEVPQKEHRAHGLAQHLEALEQTAMLGRAGDEVDSRRQGFPTRQPRAHVSSDATTRDVGVLRDCV